MCRISGLKVRIAKETVILKFDLLLISEAGKTYDVGVKKTLNSVNGLFDNF